MACRYEQMELPVQPSSEVSRGGPTASFRSGTVQSLGGRLCGGLLVPALRHAPHCSCFPTGDCHHLGPFCALHEWGIDCACWQILLLRLSKRIESIMDEPESYIIDRDAIAMNSMMQTCYSTDPSKYALGRQCQSAVPPCIRSTAMPSFCTHGPAYKSAVLHLCLAV